MASEQTDGGNAFPKTTIVGIHGEVAGVANEGGMSLRDYFAAKAMQAIISHTELVEDGKFIVGPASGTSAIANFAVFAYIMADAMLTVRQQGGAK